MMQARVLLTVASWEDRFRLGFAELLQGHDLTRLLMFYYAEYEHLTVANRDKAEQLCKARDIPCEQVKISFDDTVGTWRLINEAVSQRQGQDVMLDCTTMPRDTLWICLELLRRQNAVVQYAYHQPESYDPAWLSREPGRPRLVYGLSGIASIGRPLCLVITTGFDPERTRQLIWHYEPRVILLGFQTGEQFGNHDQNVTRHKDALKGEYREFKVIEFYLDAYSQGHGEAEIEAQVAPFCKTHNIMMTSLGPKLGAIAMFHLHVKFPEVGLAYAPSHEFNENYSSGISVLYRGRIKP